MDEPAGGQDGVDEAGEVVGDPSGGQIPAPALRETADIWFDTGRDPVITWDVSGRRFALTDPGAPGSRLELLTVPEGVRDPARVATVLAEGLAACDFPPTGGGASRPHVDRALRAAGLDPEALSRG